MLSTFLRNQKDMLPLRHMPAFFRWLDLVMERFDMSIDHPTARSITVRQAIDMAGPQHRAEWAATFSKFEDVWNQSWHRIEAFGCEEVPMMYRKQSMNFEAPICFSLPAEDDEGMCPLHLAQYLVDQHNDFMQQVSVGMASKLLSAFWVGAICLRKVAHVACLSHLSLWMCVCVRIGRSSVIVAQPRPATALDA